MSEITQANLALLRQVVKMVREQGEEKASFWLKLAQARGITVEVIRYEVKKAS